MASELQHSNMLPTSNPNQKTDAEPTTPSKPTLNTEETGTSSTSEEMGEALSPMRTHEQTGYYSSIADKYANLVEESDDEDQAVDVSKVDHEAMKRKELTRQKTSEGGKANKMRDRLKRTVSKTAN